MHGTLQRLDRAGRTIAPGAVTVMLIVLGMVPTHLPGYERIAPHVGLAAVYYWAINRPDLLPPWMAFAFGLFQDLLSGTPLGQSAMAYSLTYWGVDAQRRHLSKGNFLVDWLGFALAALVTGAVAWLAACATALTPVHPAPALFQALLSCALFPAVAWLCLKMHRAFLVAA
ncbi:MAG TPA: rod shape-determining protein MreD [Azospirillaceae bacterium]|nr:rod shape-determining protein MreD [Azospirillaceae bacterium]